MNLGGWGVEGGMQILFLLYYISYPTYVSVLLMYYLITEKYLNGDSVNDISGERRFDV